MKTIDSFIMHSVVMNNAKMNSILGGTTGNEGNHEPVKPPPAATSSMADELELPKYQG